MVKVPGRSTIEQTETGVHLIDGTYELFRHFFAVPKVTAVAKAAELSSKNPRLVIRSFRLIVPIQDFLFEPEKHS